MQYAIDVNSDYYIEVKKNLNTSTLDDGLYVAVSTVIYHKSLSYNQFKPIHSVEIVNEKSFIGWISRKSWEERIIKAEKHLVKKAKKNIGKLPNLEYVLTTKFQ